MKRKNVSLVLGLVFLVLLGGTSAAEQLTTVAVFDMDEVVLSFYSDSDIIRDYRRAEEEYRADRLVAENDLRELQARRATAVSRNNASLAQRLREDIQAQQEYIDALDERWYLTQDDLLAELEDDAFFTTVYDVAGFVGEDNGYTLILDRSLSSLGIFWYSDAVDITQDIIRELLARFR